MHSWQPLINAKNRYPSVEVWAIINPSNGPGIFKNPSYINGISLLKRANIKTLGYVATGYGHRSIDNIQSEIIKYKTWYSLDGIFFDQMAHDNSSLHVEYYRCLSNFAKINNLNKTVGNAATATRRLYVGSVDTIIIYESGAGFPTQLQYAGWRKNDNIYHWGILPYNISTLTAVCKESP